MFSRYTERAQRVILLAQEEARRLQFDYVGTEHLLLGLLAEGAGVGSMALLNMGLDLDRARAAVERVTGRGRGPVEGQIGFTPRAKKVMVELATEEARLIGHNYVATEHLLLGLLREGEGIASRVLADFGLDLEQVREEVRRLLGVTEAGPPGAPARLAPISFVSEQQGRRYQEAVEAYRARRGQEPDRHWQALLYLACLSDSLWKAVHPRLEFAAGAADLDDLPGLSPGEAAVLDVARALFRGRGQVDLAGLADALQPEQLQAVFEALSRYRRLKP
jgi:hypothetical protein